MKTLGQTTFQHFSLAEIVYNHHAKNKGKIGGKMRDLCFRKMPSLLGKKKILASQVSGVFVGFYLTTKLIPITCKDTVFISHPHSAC